MRIAGNNTSALDLSWPGLTVNLNRLDSTEGFGLWLRPVSASTLAGLLFIDFLAGFRYVF
jgi:hypothetical protein